MTTTRVSVLVIAASLATAACGRRVPDSVAGVLESQRPVAIKVADDAAKLCPLAKPHAPFQKNPMEGPPLPENPAKSTSLAVEAKVHDVYVTCSWPDPRTPDVWAGTGLPSLKGTRGMRTNPVTLPEDMVMSTCQKNAHDCLQVIAPSRYSSLPGSADLRIVRPTPDGGDAEVLVVFEMASP